jgi:UDP-N-acetylglucosamine--N-acetylmuramyl-(pentapeptide) pyrophosphoryl-undecaprenol N-acetylglucosamine transferase
VTDNHQEKNARALEAQGGAVVLLETECTGQRLMEEVRAILGDENRKKQMKSALLAMAVPDSAQRICGVLEELIRSKKE